MFNVLLDTGANIVRWSIIELSFSLKKHADAIHHGFRVKKYSQKTNVNKYTTIRVTINHGFLSLLQPKWDLTDFTDCK